MMAFKRSPNQHRDYYISADDYAILQEQQSKIMSERRKGKPSFNSGKKAYNNGINTIYADCCPEGYVEGPLLSDYQREKYGHTRGKHYYNNGKEEGRYFEGDEPEGWSRGRLKGAIKNWHADCTGAS